MKSKNHSLRLGFFSRLRATFGDESVPRRLFQQALEHHPEAIIIVEGRTGHCAFCNHKALVLTAYSRPDLNRRCINDLLAPGDITRLSEAQQHLIHNQSRDVQDVTIITQRGTRAPVDITLTNVSLANAPLHMLTLTPVEKRRAREAERTERAQRIDAMLDLLKMLDWSLEDDWGEIAKITARLTGAWTIVLYSEDNERQYMVLQAAWNLPDRFPTHLPVAYRPVMPVWDMGVAAIDPLARAAQAAGLGSLVQKPLDIVEGGHALMVAGYQTRAAYRSEEDSLSLAGALLTALIERGLRDQALVEFAGAHHAQTLLMRILLENLTCGVVLVEMKGAIVHMNETAGSLLGYLPDEVSGRDFKSVLVTSKRIQESILRGEPVPGESLTLLNRLGEEVPVWLRVLPVHPGAGLEENILVIFDDLRQYRALEDHQHRMEQLSLLGEMSAIFAHESRNLLAGISTGVQYMASKIPQDDTLHHSLRTIQTDSHRLSQLFEDFLAVSRPRKLQKEPTDIAALVEDIFQRWRPRLVRKGIETQFAADVALPLVMLDPVEFEKVLTNLFTNAIQAMQGEQGTLSINVRRVPDDAYAPGYKTPRLQIKLGDTGPGMSAEVQQRIFDPFFTTKAGGTGLGLAVARRIVAEHDGTFDVESWEGIGTVFTITLPALPNARRAS